MKKEKLLERNNTISKNKKKQVCVCCGKPSGKWDICAKCTWDIAQME
jgi:hypothetical protein